MLFLIDAQRDRHRRPDVSFVSFDRWPFDRPVPAMAAWNVIPDLAVEVVGLTNPYGEVMDKPGDEFAAGVRLVRVIYPPGA